MTKIQKILFEYQDSKYGDFSAIHQQLGCERRS